MSVQEIKHVPPTHEVLAPTKKAKKESLDDLLQRAFDPALDAASSKAATGEIFARIDQDDVLALAIADFFNRKFQLNPHHMQSQTDPKAHALANVDIHALVSMMEELKIDGAQTKQFATFVDNVIKQTPIALLQHFDENGRRAFYENLHAFLKELVQLLPRVQDQEMRTQFMRDLLEAISFSPARWPAEALQICDTIKMITEAPVTTLEVATLDHLQGIRQMKLSTLASRDVHAQSHLLKVLGTRVGIKGAERFANIDDPYLHEKPKAEVLEEQFNKLYTPYIAFEGVKECLDVEAKMDAAKIAAWFTSHQMPDWKGEKIRTQAIVHFAITSGILTERSLV